MSPFVSVVEFKTNTFHMPAQWEMYPFFITCSELDCNSIHCFLKYDYTLDYRGLQQYIQTHHILFTSINSNNLVGVALVCWTASFFKLSNSLWWSLSKIVQWLGLPCFGYLFSLELCYFHWILSKTFNLILAPQRFHINNNSKTKLCC